MNITKSRLIEIIKEEYQNVLNERRVRLANNVDIEFHGKDQAGLVGMKGKVAISKKDAKSIVYAIAREFGIRAY
jgi:hypothetical protein